MRQTLAGVSLLALVSGASAQGLLAAWEHASRGSDSFKTRPFALLCERPYSLTEAMKAFGDKAWLAEIGCRHFDADIPATLIERLPGDSAWQMRLRPPGSSGLTLWGYWGSFDPAP